MTDPAAPELVRDEIARILNRPEFGGEKSIYEELFDDVAAWFERSAGAESSERVVWAFTLAVALGFVLWVGFRIARQIGAERRSREVGADPAARVDPGRVAELERRAQAARAAGDLRGALRLYWYALVYGLGECGNLSYRDAWTNRELLERGRPDAAARALLEPLLSDIEAKEFGRVPPTDADVERVARLCERALGGAGA